MRQQNIPLLTLGSHLISAGGSDNKEYAGVQFLDWKNPWRREWLPTPVFLPREFRRQRSLAGYSPQSRKESDMTG